MLVQPYPWQTAIWQDWQTQLASQPLPHALLISGSAGLGKLNLAQALAALLLCQQPTQGLACGQCASCKLLLSGFHPDLYLVEPEEKSKFIRIEQVRELNSNLQKSSQLGGFKVALLNPAESLNINAANALLKTLEEPEPNTQFILVSHQPSALAATIKSRCQNWRLTTPTKEVALNWLSQELATNETEAASLLKAAAGLPLAALNLANKEVEANRLLLVEAFSQLLTGANPLSLIKNIKQLEAIDIFNWLQKAVIDSLKLSICGQEAVADQRQLAFYQQLTGRLSPKQLVQLDGLLVQTKPQLANNPNLELLLESLLLKIARLITSR